MSVLSMVEEAIRLGKAEETKINENIQLYRGILQSLRRPHDKESAKSEVTECVDKDTDPDILPEEKQDMAFLEEALEKAVRIRSGSTVSTKGPHCSSELSLTSNVPADPIKKPLGNVQAAGTTMQQNTNTRATYKSTGRCSKEPRKPSGSSGRTSHHWGKPKVGTQRVSVQKRTITAKKPPSQSSGETRQASTVCELGDHCQSHNSKEPKAEIQDRPGAGDSGQAASTCRPPRKDPVPNSLSGALQKGIPHDQVSKWTSLRSKQNRLWDKVMAAQCQPVPERKRFIERMSSTFPSDWPSGSPTHTKTQVDRLTRECRDLTQCYQTERLLASQASAMGMKPDTKERELESYMMLEGMEKIAADLRERAGKVKQECIAWDRWRPEGGRLRPRGLKGEQGAEAGSPSLPVTVTYSTEEELRELGRLTLRVALLEQERHLQQALSDTLSPHLSSMLSGPDHPNPSCLRDMYSLLAEGGERFPALVLDTEAD